MKKFFIFLISAVLIGALGFGVVWSIANFDKLKLAMSGTSLYSKEDLDNAYNDGYNTAFTDKADLLLQIENFKVALDSKSSELELLKDKLSNYDEISAENFAIKQQIKALEKEIENLNLTISAYEKFVEDVEEADKLVATFMYDGAIYSLQRYENGAIVSIDDPVSTEDVRFIGWTLNGVDVDLSNYVITESVTFDAKLVKSSAVTFNVKGEIVNSQRVSYGETIADIPENPDVYGYTFKGWSKDGVNVIDVTSDVIESTTEYFALFELFEVKIEFKYFATTIPGSYYYEVLTDIPWEMQGNDDYYQYSFYYLYTENGLLDNVIEEKVGVLCLSSYLTPGDFSIPVEENIVFLKNNSFDSFATRCGVFSDTTFYLVDPTL